MTRTVLILLAGFLLTLAAGGVLGRIASPTAKSSGAGPDGGWLAQQLQLTADQRSKVQGIWDQTHTQMDMELQQRTGIDQKFQKDVLSLLSPEQKTKYAAMSDTAIKEKTSIDDKVQKLIDGSIQQTKGILTGDQKEKYEQLLSRFPAKRASDSTDQQGVPPGYIEHLSFDP